MRLVWGWSGSRALFQSQSVSDPHQLSPHRRGGLALELAGQLPAPGEHGSQETYQVLAGVKFHSWLYIGLRLQRYVQSD